MPEKSDATIPKGDSVDGQHKLPISYSGSVIFESDIPSPNITQLTGKAKFLTEVSPSKDHASIGYVITVAVDPLDRSKLPEKYKKGRTVYMEAGPVSTLPLEEATYQVYFRLALIDRDGFVLQVVDSPKHNTGSGETCQIQAQTEPVVPKKFGRATDTITLHMVVERCLSANRE